MAPAACNYSGKGDGTRRRQGRTVQTQWKRSLSKDMRTFFRTGKGRACREDEERLQPFSSIGLPAATQTRGFRADRVTALAHTSPTMFGPPYPTSTLGDFR